MSAFAIYQADPQLDATASNKTKSALLFAYLHDSYCDFEAMGRFSVRK